MGCCTVYPGPVTLHDALGILEDLAADGVA